MGGLAADRFSRHKLVVLTQTLSMLQAFALAALTLSGRVQVWHVLALAAVLGTINAFDMPGRQSLVIHMTSKEDLINAISLNSAVFNAARVVGPGDRRLLVAAVGEGVCFLLNGVSFLAVIGCLLAMRLPPFERTNQDSPWSHLIDGFRYAWHHEAVRRVLAVMAAATLSGMPALVLMPFFADDIFHRGSQGLGFLMGAMGIGAVVGTLVLARRTHVSGLPRVMVMSGPSDGLRLPGVCAVAVVLFLAGYHAVDRIQCDAADGLGEHHHPDAHSRRIPRPHHGALFHDGGRTGSVWKPGCRCPGGPFRTAPYRGARSGSGHLARRRPSAGA